MFKTVTQGVWVTWVTQAISLLLKICAVKYMQKSGAQCLELVSSQQFRKDTESLNQMFKGYELLKVKWFTKKLNVFLDVKTPWSCSVYMLYIHIFLVSSMCFSLLLLYEAQKQPEEGLCLVFCSETNSTEIYCCPSKFMRSLLQLYRKKNSSYKCDWNRWTFQGPKYLQKCICISLSFPREKSAQTYFCGTASGCY